MTLKNYQILGKIGEGTFSHVVKAYSKEHGLIVAIKVLQNNSSEYSEIKKEISIMSHLSHPIIPKYYESFVENDSTFIVMEYIEGTNLLEFVNNHNGIPESLAKKIFCQILSGIEYIHSKNIMHRDLKAENILINTIMNVKIIDFGMSKNSYNSLFNSFCGSVPYCAPERIVAQPYSFSADIWSLGIILFSMVACQLPFYHEDQQMLGICIVQEDPEYDDDMSPELVSLLSRILEKDPNKRICLREIIEHPFIKNEYRLVQKKIEILLSVKNQKTTIARRSTITNSNCVLDQLKLKKGSIMKPMNVIMTPKRSFLKLKPSKKRRDPFSHSMGEIPRPTNFRHD
ncbi:AGC family protein kinase [Tritrichomonas foetus]|uniref:AGC family protein kinase n=1 Tax=Tritrichomonas foetus TaxID=1144522 RepID=A0A1J4KI83_9EUKA|nr:AGC family protein kinase [Tritrichomonas foetus]|eukprot:OHT09045.1 AGC family protein kinase [Tritrichomonas foetus]